MVILINHNVQCLQMGVICTYCNDISHRDISCKKCKAKIQLKIKTIKQINIIMYCKISKIQYFST